MDDIARNRCRMNTGLEALNHPTNAKLYRFWRSIDECYAAAATD